MFSSMKMKESMESELFGAFQVKMVAKITMLEFAATHFMHLRVKESTGNVCDLVQFENKLKQFKKTRYRPTYFRLFFSY